MGPPRLLLTRLVYKQPTRGARPRLGPSTVAVFQAVFFVSLSRSSVAEGIPADNPHLVLLFFMSQLFLRELTKCHRLVQIIPMDMSGYYGKSRPFRSKLNLSTRGAVFVMEIELSAVQKLFLSMAKFLFGELEIGPFRTKPCAWHLFLLAGRRNAITFYADRIPPSSYRFRFLICYR